MNFRIYYGDGSVRDSSEGVLPVEDVQVIVARNWISYSQDWYVLCDDEWHGFRELRALERFKAEHDCVVYFGRPSADFYDILKKAKADPLLEGWRL